MIGYDGIYSQCFKDTVGAYQKVRQDGELHIPAFMAALDAYKRHQGKAEDAGRQVLSQLLSTPGKCFLPSIYALIEKLFFVSR